MKDILSYIFSLLSNVSGMMVQHKNIHRLMISSFLTLLLVNKPSPNFPKYVYVMALINIRGLHRSLKTPIDFN